MYLLSNNIKIKDAVHLLVVIQCTGLQYNQHEVKALRAHRIVSTGPSVPADLLYRSATAVSQHWTRCLSVFGSIQSFFSVQGVECSRKSWFCLKSKSFVFNIKYSHIPEKKHQGKYFFLVLDFYFRLQCCADTKSLTA